MSKLLKLVVTRGGVQAEFEGATVRADWGEIKELRKYVGRKRSGGWCVAGVEVVEDPEPKREDTEFTIKVGLDTSEALQTLAGLEKRCRALPMIQLKSYDWDTGEWVDQGEPIPAEPLTCSGLRTCNAKAETKTDHGQDARATSLDWDGPWVDVGGGNLPERRYLRKIEAVVSAYAEPADQVWMTAAVWGHREVPEIEDIWNGETGSYDPPEDWWSGLDWMDLTLGMSGFFQFRRDEWWARRTQQGHEHRNPWRALAEGLRRSPAGRILALCEQVAALSLGRELGVRKLVEARLAEYSEMFPPLMAPADGEASLHHRLKSEREMCEGWLAETVDEEGDG